jgi:hypothetical protein
VRVRLPIAALVLAPMIAATGCGSRADTSMPPLTPEPTITLPPEDGTALRRSFPARMVLYRYLRGMAAGDRRVCLYLAPAYDRDTFGRTGCRAWIPQVRRHLSATDLAALRQVTVPTATQGPGPADYTVLFSDLHWRAHPARTSGVLAESYTLRHAGNRWLIAS